MVTRGGPDERQVVKGTPRWSGSAAGCYGNTLDGWTGRKCEEGRREVGQDARQKRVRERVREGENERGSERKQERGRENESTRQRKKNVHRFLSSEILFLINSPHTHHFLYFTPACELPDTYRGHSKPHSSPST